MKITKFLAILGLIGVTTIGLLACEDDSGGGTDPQPEAPTAPTNVSASVDGTSATVSWTPGDNADSHEVVLTTSSEDDRSRSVGGDATSTTFDGLTRGKTYSAQVTAVNEVGEASSQAVAFDIQEEEASFVRINDDIEEDMTFTSDKTYILEGPIFVGRDVGPDGNAEDGKSVTLTIEPGTTILGDDAPQGTRATYLTVNRGSKIIADANANRSDKTARPNPEDVIVFTSAKPRGQRARGDWGGLIINGRGRLNTGQEASGEGDTGFYGGNDDNDSSGILRGVRVEFAGDNITTTDQLNGIALQGTGAGTVFDYVQVHYNTDDGTEPFGGAVSQTHVVMTGIGDDSFDGTDGYRGFMQYGIAQQRNDDADQGFEFSTGGDNDQGTPASMAVVSNFTLIGAGEQQGTGEITIGAESDHGILMREGTNFRLFNVIATGFGDSGFCVEDTQAAANADNRLGGSSDPTSTLRVENSVLWNNASTYCDATGDGGYSAAENETFWTSFDNVVADPNLPNEAFSIGTRSSPPNVIPTAATQGYTAFDAATMNGAEGLVMPSGDDIRTLETASYAGAVEPGTALEDAWYYGWTVWAIAGSDSRPNHEGN